MDGISFIIFWILPEQSSEHISIFRVVVSEVPQGHCSFEIAEILWSCSRHAMAVMRHPGFLGTAQTVLAVPWSFLGFVEVSDVPGARDSNHHLNLKLT